MREAVAPGPTVGHGGVPSDEGPLAPVLALPAVAAQGTAEAVGVPEQLDVEVHCTVPSLRLRAPQVHARKG
jgi:hypothetical protein